MANAVAPRPMASPLTIQIIRQMKNTSSTDFWSRESKKIAGAYSASSSPAMRPTRLEKNRRPASPSHTHAIDPRIAWQILIISRSRPAIA